MSRGKICQCQKSRTTLFILSKRNDDLIVKQNVRFEFRQNQRHYCLYGCTALKNVTVITSTHNLLLSSIKVVHFLLSRINKLDCDFLYWKNGPPRSHVTSLLTPSVLMRFQSFMPLFMYVLHYDE